MARTDKFDTTTEKLRCRRNRKNKTERRTNKWKTAARRFDEE